MKTTSTTLLLTLALTMHGASAAPPAPSTGLVAIGAPLRQATLDPLLGPARELSAYRGKPLVINVWASWCGPCRAEMGSLQRLAQRYGKQFNVIGVSTDDYRDRASAFLRGAGISFPNYIDHQLQLEIMLGADRIPLTLLVDARGRVLARHYGSREWDSPQSVALIASTLRIRP
jgi:thiol-disulfide isomerase/thioredoxin